MANDSRRSFLVRSKLVEMKRGKKSLAWDRTRAKLKRQFFEMNIVRCEKCGSGFNLSFAHRLKRRFITDEAELMTVALLCVPCHTGIEHSGHERMYKAITALINNRTAN